MAANRSLTYLATSPLSLALLLNTVNALLPDPLCTLDRPQAEITQTSSTLGSGSTALSFSTTCIPIASGAQVQDPREVTSTGTQVLEQLDSKVIR